MNVGTYAFEAHGCEVPLREMEQLVGKDSLETVISSMLDGFFYYDENVANEFNDMFDYLSQLNTIVADAIASGEERFLVLLDEVICVTRTAFEGFLHAMQYVRFRHIQFMGFDPYWRYVVRLEA
jgi:hypothetical protein